MFIFPLILKEIQLIQHNELNNAYQRTNLCEKIVQIAVYQLPPIETKIGGSFEDGIRTQHIIFFFFWTHVMSVSCQGVHTNRVHFSQSTSSNSVVSISEPSFWKRSDYCTGWYFVPTSKIARLKLVSIRKSYRLRKKIIFYLSAIVLPKKRVTKDLSCDIQTARFAAAVTSMKSAWMRILTNL